MTRKRSGGAYTAGHSARVAELAATAGGALGLPDDECIVRRLSPASRILAAGGC